MRMRYERRDPRPEDLRDIEELKSRIDAQDRDLRQMTEQLREYQLFNHQQQQKQQNPSATNNNQSNAAGQRKQKGKNNNNSNNKSKVNNCNVIYEENEDRETSPNSGIFAKTVDP